jgi:signal transduction histidine kinase/PAS domain-containing protein
MHRLLRRQIGRYLGDAPPSMEGWQRFLDAVNEAYEQFDVDRGMLERALELSAQDVLEANSKLRAAFEAFPDVFLRLDATGKVTDYTVGRTTQLRLHEPVLGRSLQDVLRWDDGMPIELAIRRVQKTKEIVSVEHSLLEAGTGYYYEARVVPLLDDQTIVIIRDISEHRRAEEELRARARQQATVAALGQRGLAESDLSALLDEAVARIADTMGAEHCTVWELRPDGHTLAVRAGVGWSQRPAATRTFAVGLDSPAGYTLMRREPVVVDDFHSDARFRDSPLVREHGLASGITVLIQGRSRPFGVLAAHSDRRRGFTRDDVHFLQAAANVLAAAVERRRAEEEVEQAKEAAEERTRELAALLELSGVVSSTLELRPLLSLVLDRLKTVVDYSASTITVFDDSAAIILDYRGPLPRERLVGLRLPEGSPPAELIQEIARRRGPVITEDLGGESLLTRHLAAEGLAVGRQTLAHARSQLGVPLVAKGRVIGTLGVVHATPGFYTERHARLAMAFAQQAAAAIENARLYEAARERAALEERQRLARELHDSVSQALYGIALNISTANALVEAAPEQARELLQDVLRLAGAGLAEMRALIFELRPESLAQEGLVAALEKQAAAARARHGLDVRAALGPEPDVPLPVKEALFRIAQEALHNTVKHARARSVEVSLGAESGDLVLCVHDDGRGFDPQGAFPGHLGLRSMRERAAAVGGAVEIESAPGRGTKVRAHVPGGAGM